MKQLVDANVEAYLQRMQASTDPILREMEERGAREGFPIIGPLVGRLGALLAGSIGARNVFEMGSGFGYSTVWFARAVGPGGKVYHTDGSEKLSAQARGYLERSGLLDRCTFNVGDACEIIQRHAGPFDIIFIDIDKHGYPDAFALAKERVRKGGLIITDNTLWSGRVADPSITDPDTLGVKRYNELAFSSPDFLTTILPVRDGVAVSLKLT